MSTPYQAYNDGGLPSNAFQRLQETFTAHLEQSRGGMGFCAYRRGQPLVRLYGGSTARRDSPATKVMAPWGPETKAVLFSGTKGVAATVAAMLVDQGLLDVHHPVADYWPEFAAAGKGWVTVAQLLDHTVGLPYVDPEPAGEGADLDNAANAAVLAGQAPRWEPGSRVAYHAITFGYLLNEVFVRATGRSGGELIADLISRPLALDLHLGLPRELENRVAPVFRAEDYAISTYLGDPERRKIVERMYGSFLLGETLRSNTVEMHRAEFLAGGAIATADSVAKLYSHIVAGDLISAPTLAEATRTWSEGKDAVNDRPVRFGLGYELADPIGTYGPVTPAFGHSGAGGSLHGAWPGRDIGFSFLTNEMLAENRDTRAKDLLGVLATSL